MIGGSDHDQFSNIKFVFRISDIPAGDQPSHTVSDDINLGQHNFSPVEMMRRSFFHKIDKIDKRCGHFRGTGLDGLLVMVVDTRPVPSGLRYAGFERRPALRIAVVDAMNEKQGGLLNRNRFPNLFHIGVFVDEGITSSGDIDFLGAQVIFFRSGFIRSKNDLRIIGGAGIYIFRYGSPQFFFFI